MMGTGSSCSSSSSYNSRKEVEIMMIIIWCVLFLKVNIFNMRTDTACVSSHAQVMATEAAQ